MARRSPKTGKGLNYQTVPAGPEFVPNVEQRVDDDAYKTYLKEGEARRGTFTARETGARQLAAKGEIARIKGAQAEMKKQQEMRATARARKRV